MKTNKKICIVMLDMTEDYRDDYLIGIEKQARKFEYQTVTFSIPMLNGKFAKREEEIYQLIDFDQYDGVIFFENSFSAIKSIGNMVEKHIFDNCHVPVMVLGESMLFSETYMPDNSHGTKMLTDHLIEEHGCETLYFLGGEPNQVLHNELGFMNSLQEHQIPYTNDNLIYGGYWLQCGEALAKDIAYNTVEKPDAVVCQDDTVALFFIKALSKFGIRVPQDLLVTGFGARNDSKNAALSITTYPSNAEYHGRRVMSRLHSMICNEKEIPISFPKSDIITGMSCGCSDQLPSNTRLLLEQHEKLRQQKIYYCNSELEEKCYTCSSYADLYPVIFNSYYIIRDAIFFSVNIAEDENTSRCIYMSNQPWSDTPVVFPSKDISPAHLHKHLSRHLHVVPMTFNNEFIGHAIIGYETPLVYNNIIKLYISRIAIAIYFIKNKIETKEMSSEAIPADPSEASASVVRTQEMIFIKKGSSLHKVPLDNILFFESEGRKTVAVMKSGRYEIKKTLSELEALYEDSNFFRASKSALINLTKVVSVTSDVDRTLLATLTGKVTVRISRKNANEFKEKVNIS